MQVRILAIAGVIATVYAADFPRCGHGIGGVKVARMLGRAADGTVVAFDKDCHKQKDLESNHCDWGKALYQHASGLSMQYWC